VPEELHSRLLAVANWSEENLEERHRFGGDHVKLCNIGCGFGWLELRGLEKGRLVDVLSVEPSESDLKVFKELVTSESVTALVASGLDIPIADSSVDHVVLTEVLEHIPKIARICYSGKFLEFWRRVGVHSVLHPNERFARVSGIQHFGGSVTDIMQLKIWRVLLQMPVSKN
jgi:hypothetical protein